MSVMDKDCASRSPGGRAIRRWVFRGAVGFFLAVLMIGLLLPERLVIPVEGAGERDWNHKTFWHPWGASGVHRGIDIFAPTDRSVIAATNGFVVYAGFLKRGGQVVFVLGPKWRFHYYAHLSRIDVRAGQWVETGEGIGTVGTTGNAFNRPPHLHYSIMTPIPYVWRFEFGRWGWQRMFYLNPHEKLMSR